MFRQFLQKMQKGLWVLAPRRRPTAAVNKVKCEKMVDDLVKEGFFTVVAVKGEEVHRFVVELVFLTDPAFLRLLDAAEEEYGFRQRGVLAVPCRPEELQQIIEDGRERCACSGGRYFGCL